MLNCSTAIDTKLFQKIQQSYGAPVENGNECQIERYRRVTLTTTCQNEQ